MKSNRVLTAILALSVVWAVVTLSWRHGVVGVPVAGSNLTIPTPSPTPSQSPTPTPAPTPTVAPTLADFKFLSASAEITHETANCPASSPNPAGVISCSPDLSPSWFSDSYEIDAALALNQDNDLRSDLNHPILLLLAPGTCDDLIKNSVNASAFVTVIPGNDIELRPKGEGIEVGLTANVVSFYTSPTIEPLRNSSRLELDGWVPTRRLFPKYYNVPPSPTFLHISGNGDLCQLTGPMALGMSMGPNASESLEKGLVPDSDFACINILKPKFSTLDISQSFCSD